MTINIKDQKGLGTALSELMESEGVTIERLSAVTNIPSRFLIAMKDGNIEKLPAEPYVRGYLIKISSILKTDPENLISAYRESASTTRTRIKDKLPSNEFAAIPLKKGWLAVICIICALIGIILFRFDDIFGVPQLNIDLPIITDSESLKIEGGVRPRDKLTLNDQIIYTDEAGRFSDMIFLNAGLNTLRFNVKRFLGKEVQIIKEVYYQKPEIQNPADSKTTL